MGSETTSPSLLARLRNPQDEAAWRTFESRYRDLIRRFCRRRGLQTADAEDVSQLVLLAMTRTLPGFQYMPERGRFRDYLGRVAENAVRQHLKSPTRSDLLLETSVLAEITTVEEGPLEPAWLDEWTQHHLGLAMQAVRAKTSPESLALFQRLLAGETVAEVARATGSSIDAVYKAKQRVAERLRHEIEGQLRDEDPDAA
jgi:RNA polymerase sigma-70 factor (ECF subfamily)